MYYKVLLFKWGHMINKNKNEAEIKKTGLGLDTNIVNIKCVSVY